MSTQHETLVRELIAREAHHLDSQEWDQWLGLYEEDAVFWIPTWRDESTLTSDPLGELSYIYLKGRSFLQERVHRLRSGKAVSSMPMPRTAHHVTSSLVSRQDDGSMLVKSIWSSNVYLHKEKTMVSYAGRYEHIVDVYGGAASIRQKKIILINDYLISKLDFFYV